MEKQIETSFSEVKDPRVKNRCLHSLEDILFIAFCTLLSNGEDFADMVEFGQQRKEWLENYLELRNGIPSHDTFNRVFQLIDPEQLSLCLSNNGSQLIESVGGKLVNIDGKKIKGVSPKSKGNHGLYILSAWVGENRFCIGQKKVEDKSNEITAIPELIDSLDLAGSTITIDAIGCQTNIAKKIIKSEANYLLAVKKNQAKLLEEISAEHLWKSTKIFNEQWEYNHGRYEKRKCQIVDAEEFLSPELLGKWEQIKTIVRIEAERTINNITNSQIRYYISSERNDAAFYNNAVRDHWSIENHLHWHLDVTFNEDKSRARLGNVPINLNILRKIALHRISNMKDKLSLKKRRFRASMNSKYLGKIIED